MKKLKDILKESNVQIGKVYSNPYATAFVKENEEQEEPQIELSEEQKKAFLEAVKQYKKYGEAVYRNAGLGEVYESIKNMVEMAGKVTLSETDDWFDNVTVSRHMKRMGESFKVFEKTLKEVSTLQQRLEASYDEIGEVLGKYYETNETEEVEEGNEFGAARTKAIANGDDSFEVDGKKYPVKDVDKDDKENAKEFTKESMKLTDMIKKPSVSEASEEFVVYVEKDNGRKKLLHTKQSQRAANMFLTKNADKILNQSGIRTIGSMSKFHWEKDEAQYAENIKKTDMKTVTKKEWDKAHKDYKGMIKGQPYMMYMDKKGTTVYGPVNIKESVVNEAKYDIGMARKGNGITIYNKAEEENGDYKNVAHIDNKGKVKYLDKKVPSNIKKEIEAEAQKMKESVNEGTKMIKLKDLMNESFGMGELPSSKLMKMKVPAKQVLKEGTRSQVGYIDSNGNIKSAYVHFDGYPENMKPGIKKHMKSEKDVKTLIKRGGARGIFDDKDIEYYDDKSAKPMSGNLEDIGKYIKDSDSKGGAEFVYLYNTKDKKWYFADTYKDKELKKLY